MDDVIFFSVEVSEAYNTRTIYWYFCFWRGTAVFCPDDIHSVDKKHQKNYAVNLNYTSKCTKEKILSEKKRL